MGVYLFKKTAGFLLLLFCLSLNTSASIFLVEPTEKMLGNGDSIELGQIARGEMLRIVVQRKSGLDFPWDSITVNRESLPQDWKTETIVTDKTLIALVTLPSNAEESIQRISFSLQSSESPFLQESFSVYVAVKKNLLKASMERLKQDSLLGNAAVFSLLLNNDSIAGQTVRIESSLPHYWFEPIEVAVPAGERLDLNLNVYPRSHGFRNFSFTVSSQLNSFEQSFDAELKVFSTLSGKFYSAAFGFPFFTLALLPQFLINAFLALLS